MESRNEEAPARSRPRCALRSGQQIAEFLCLGIHEFLTLVITQERLAVVTIEDVVGVEGNLSSTAGSIDDILRYRITGGVTSKSFDDLETLFDRGPEVGGALDEIALIKIIRLHPAAQELMHKSTLYIDAIVNSLQKDRLVAEWDTGICKAAQRVSYLNRQLARMIGMN